MKRHQKAIDALRRARAVLDGECPLCGRSPAEAQLAEWSDRYAFAHVEMPSLMLFGLAVADVTAAEEALDG